MAARVAVPRNLSGIYFRWLNPETGEYENRCYEDLPEADQRQMLVGRHYSWLESMVLTLAKSLREIGDFADVAKG